MATKKGGGSTSNGRDSNPQYLGIKRFGNEMVEAGEIIVRQRGTRFYPGSNAGIGKDHTIFAKIKGKVEYKTGGVKNRKFVNILSDTPNTKNS